MAGAPASALPIAALQLPAATGPADPLADHVHRVLVRERCGVVAATRVPDAAAVIDLAPRDGMVRAHQRAPVPDERMRLEVVRALVERLQNVDGAARVRLEVVELVRDVPALREIVGGGVVALRDDRRLEARARVADDVRVAREVPETPRRATDATGVVREAGLVAEQLAVPRRLVTAVR